MQSLHWRRLDQWRIENKLSLMYKITHNLIAIPISDFLIPLVRPSRYYHPLSYRLITATTDCYNCSFFPRAVFHWNNLPLETVACSTLEQFNQAVCKILFILENICKSYLRFTFFEIAESTKSYGKLTLIRLVLLYVLQHKETDVY